MVGENDIRKAFFFLLPIGIVYMVFLLLPVLISIGLSFTEYDIITPAKFVGLKNFVATFQNERTLGIFLTTFRLSITLVILHSTIGLALALLVHSASKKLQGAFRLLLYTPVAITTASMAIAWQYLFQKDFGVFNWFLGLLNIEPIAWLTSSEHVFKSIAIFSVWKFVGNSFLYYYIGLNTIPQELYEASEIDGAGPVSKFIKITFPLLSPTVFFVVMILLINTLQIFQEPFLLTHGGPGDVSRTVNLFIYEVAFHQFKMGLSSSIAVLLFVIILALTIFQNKMSTKWVNYDR